jgi:dienelactone hydrolase
VLGKRLLKGAFAVTLAAILGLAGLLTLLWVEHNTDLTLPAPSGPFMVSRVVETWIDDHRADSLVESPGRRTELVAWIWYPSTRSPKQKPAEYLPADWRRELARRQGVLLSTFLTRDLSLVHPHSVMDETLPPEPSHYPVVILRAGLGALTTQYTTLAEDLASHGYVVVGFDAPYRTGIVVFPDGRVVTRPPSLNPETLTGEAQERLVARLLTAWVGDIGFVVDRLQRLNASASSRFGGRLDLRKVGVVGHSLGGASAAQFCHEDSRCGAGADVDGALHGSVVREGLQRPFMFLLSDHGDSLGAVDRQILADIRSVYDRLPPSSRMGLLIRGANHFSCSDQLLIRSQAVIRMLRLAGALGLEPRRGLRVTGESVRRFLDVHLKGAPAESLLGLSRTYPELRFRLPQG